MTKEEIKIKKMFCKDNGIKINIYSSPYFEYFLNLYNYKEKYKNYIEEIELNFLSKELYIEYYYKISDKIIDFIKNSETYKKFINEDMNKFTKNITQISKSDCFKDNEVGNLFISIDLKKANYSSLKYYNKNFNSENIEFSESWEEFIKKFTTINSIIYSKYLREVIFGNLNPKRIQTFERYIVEKILKEFINFIEGYNINNFLYSINSDEIILKIDNQYEKQFMEYYDFDFFKYMILKEFDIEIKIEKFKLLKAQGSNGYIKKFINIRENQNKYEIKCAAPYEIPFITKILNNQKITEEDTFFEFENRICKMLEIPNIIIIGE